MLAGKQFHRAVRGLTLAYEALSQMFVSAFNVWCEKNQQGLPDNFWQQLVTTQAVFHSRDQKASANAVKDLDSLIAEYITPLLQKFKEFGRAQSPTFQYWEMFLDAIQLMLLNIRAEREGSWTLHLQTVSSMLPYFFSTNRRNYARWMPVYILEMVNIPQNVRSAFEDGQFSFRESPGCFNGIWSEMGTEKTVIRDSKSDGGIVGLTRKKSALLRWTLTRHIMAEYSSVMNERSGMKKTENIVHQQAQPAAMKQDEKHVKALVQHLKDIMTKPFDTDVHPDVLVNISTGLHDTDQVQKSLLASITIGKQRVQSFVKSTLSADGTCSFYNPISKSLVQTFGDMVKKTKIHLQGRSKNVNISPELVFRRALTIANSRDDVTLESILNHPVGAVPISIFHEDGTMRKCTTAELGQILEEAITTAVELPSGERRCSVYIRDAMAMIQMMHGNEHKIFDDLGAAYLRLLLLAFSKADTVVDVFDRYDAADSVKSCERARRTGSVVNTKQYSVTGGRSVPPWKKFLTVGSNKQALTNFLCAYLMNHIPLHLSIYPERKLVLAGGFVDGTETKCVTSRGPEEMPEMHSTHEEADTRMLLHAIFANSNFGSTDVTGRVVIKSPHTDVLVLAIHYFPQMLHVRELWMETGTATSVRNTHRFIPVHDICESISPIFCQILPTVHSLTGCDSTSSFLGIGKKTVFNVKGGEFFADLVSLSGLDAIKAAFNFIAILYDPKEKETRSHDKLNTLRMRLATRKETSLAKLPPCETSFKQHVKRAMWQTKIWMSAHVSRPNLGTPLDHGWQADTSGLSPVFLKDPLPRK